MGSAPFEGESPQEEKLLQGPGNWERTRHVNPHTAQTLSPFAGDSDLRCAQRSQITLPSLRELAHCRMLPQREVADIITILTARANTGITRSVQFNAGANEISKFQEQIAERIVTVMQAKMHFQLSSVMRHLPLHEGCRVILFKTGAFGMMKELSDLWPCFCASRIPHRKSQVRLLHVFVTVILHNQTTSVHLRGEKVAHACKDAKSKVVSIAPEVFDMPVRTTTEDEAHHAMPRAGHDKNSNSRRQRTMGERSASCSIIEMPSMR